MLSLDQKTSTTLPNSALARTISAFEQTSAALEDILKGVNSELTTSRFSL